MWGPHRELSNGAVVHEWAVIHPEQAAERIAVYGAHKARLGTPGNYPERCAYCGGLIGVGLHIHGAADNNEPT